MAWFLFTALPTDLVTTSPTRGPSVSPGWATTVRGPCRERVPDDRTRRKSSARRSVDQSDGEALPSLTAAGAHHGSSGAGLHAVPESVASLPATHLGLIGSFHGKIGFSWGNRTGRKGRPAKVTKRCRLMSKTLARTLAQTPSRALGAHLTAQPGSRNFVRARENWIRPDWHQFAPVGLRKALGKLALTWGSPGVQVSRNGEQGRFSRS